MYYHVNTKYSTKAIVPVRTLVQAVKRNKSRFPPDFLFPIDSQEQKIFLQLRSMLATHEDLRRKIDEMERRYDAKFHAVFATLRQMPETPIPPKQQIGFHASSQSFRGPSRKGKLPPIASI